MWWYGPGWKQEAAAIRERLARIADLFSIDLLVKTLFSPYRQISAGKVDGSLNVRWHAWVDRAFSRVIGAILRSLMIIIGSLILLVSVLFGCALLLIWPLLPLLPVFGLVLTILGWLPWNQ